MIGRRPLYATTADSRLMLWTPEAAAAREALRRGRNTLVHGATGTGKTTVLNQVAHALRGAGRQALFVALRGVSDVADVPELILQTGVDPGPLGGSEPALVRASPADEGPLAGNRAVRSLRALPRGTVVLLDDVAAGVGHALFGRLRDELWQVPVVWGVAVDEDDVGALLTPPADAFFDTRVALRPLDASERVDLLTRRAEAELAPSVVTELGRSGPGNPRQLVDYARLVAEDRIDPQQLIVAAHRRLERAEAVAGRDGAMLVTEMQGLGPVSASDETLAGRLGWPRPRIAATLSRLEGAGVARSFLEAREGRTGRPRKLYELIPETELLEP